MVQGMIWHFPVVSSFLKIFHHEWSLLPKIFFMSYDKKMTENSCSKMRRDNLRKPNSWRLGWTMHVDVPNYYYQFLKPIICRLKFFMWEFSFLKATTHQIKILSYKSTPYIQIPIYWAPKYYTEGLDRYIKRTSNVLKTNVLWGLLWNQTDLWFSSYCALSQRSLHKVYWEDLSSSMKIVYYSHCFKIT